MRLMPFKMKFIARKAASSSSQVFPRGTVADSCLKFTRTLVSSVHPGTFISIYEAAEEYTTRCTT